MGRGPKIFLGLLLLLAISLCTKSAARFELYMLRGMEPYCSQLQMSCFPAAINANAMMALLVINPSAPELLRECSQNPNETTQIRFTCSLVYPRNPFSPK
jgi:hypothetical protein